MIPAQTDSSSRLQLSGHLDDDPYIEELAAYLATQVIPSHPDGFTFDPRSWCFPAFDVDTYITSLAGFESRFSRLPTVIDVTAWQRRAKVALRRRATYVGGWWNEGLYYLDVSVAVRGLQQAKNTGYTNLQRSIFHPATNRAIFLEPAAPAAA